MEHHKDHQAIPETRSDLFFNATPLFAVAEPSNGATTPQAAPRGSKPLHISTPADVLAYIQCTLGFAPQNSLAVIAFADNKMSTVVRCNLPEDLQHMARCDTPESVTFMDRGMTEHQELQFNKIGREIGELIAREPSTSSCLLVYIADDVTVSDQHALAVMGTANSVIAAQFGVQGIPVQESWLIHHNRLWHLRCAATTDCDVQGDAVGDPTATDIFRKLGSRGKSTSQQTVEPRRLRFPPTSTSTTSSQPDTSAMLSNRPQVVLNFLTLWDKHLREGPTMLHSSEVAELLAAVEHPPIRDALVITACFDLSTAIRGLTALGQFPAPLATLAQVQSSKTDGAVVKECLKGQSDRSPNWDRIAELERLCHQLLPLSDGRSGGAVAGLLVWIEWVRGRGSIALDYVRQARRHFPTEQSLALLERVVGAGTVAGWATRVDSAWTPQHAA